MALIKGKQLADAAIIESKIADSAVTAAKLSGSIPATKLDLTGSFDFTNGTTTVATPSQDGHAANKGYVDSVKQALDIKESVRVASTDTLNNENASTGFTYANGVFTEDATDSAIVSIDGVNLALGDRILIKDQGTASENGIYEVTTVGDGSSVLWVITRAGDFNTDADVTAGAFCFVEEGAVNGDYGFVLTTNESITLGTTGLTFTQFSGAGQVVAGNGISKSGSTLSVDLDATSGLAVSSNGLKIDASTLTDEVLNPALDSIVFIDSDGGTKRETIVDFANNFINLGLSATNGFISVTVDTAGGLEVDANQGVAVKEADDSLSSDVNGIKVNLNANASIAIKGSAGLASAIPTSSDKAQTPASVSADNTSTTLTITATPIGDVRVAVNGIMVDLGDGLKTKDCYFSADAGSTAKALSAIATGDTLFWNGVSVYALDATDLVDFIYSVV